MRNPAGDPADNAYGVQRLVAEVVELRAQVKALQDSKRTYGQRGTITAYSGGTQMTVSFAGGRTQTCRYVNSGWTPSAGLKVLVVFTPEGFYAVGPDSITT
jgi:hypothetical protein